MLVRIDIPESFQKKAEYIFKLFSSIWGIPLRFGNGNETKPQIIYTCHVNRIKESNAVVIPFDQELYQKDTLCKLSKDNDLDLWSKSSGMSKDIDLVASSYRLINYIDEQQVKEEKRNKRGIFTVDALPPDRQIASDIPLIENHASYLLKRLIMKNPEIEKHVVPKWPHGKKYVISLTHDTDAVSLGAPAELLTNFSKFLVKRNRRYWEMFKKGWNYIGKPSDNPLFGFPKWQEYESANNFRSCFYLFTKDSKTGYSINDCKSSVGNQQINWDILRELVDNGWEFGLHPSIEAKDNLDSFIFTKHFLEKKLGSPIYGLRHHYWALDWRSPHLTFRKHVNAGFRYDTSIAWRNKLGFRAATCHPFQPYDQIWDKPLNMYEIPTCLMDAHFITSSDDVTDEVRTGRNIIKTVTQCGGVAVLDWHTETTWNILEYKNYFKILKEVLKPFLNDSDAWFARPWDITRHWNKRAISLTE